MRMKIIFLLSAIIIIACEIAAQNQNVIIDQKLSNGQPVGVLKKWEGSYWSNPFNPGSQFSFPLYSEQVILGDQEIHSAEKYNNWNEDFSDVKNHHKFTITPYTNNLTSWFEPAQTGITIKTSLEGTEATGGVIIFKDPWFIDYPDAVYNNQLRNRGMDNAYPRQRTSPFYPNATTNYEYGQTYKGVFLDREISPSNAYYKVCVPEEQTISINGQNRKFYFRNWAGSEIEYEDEKLEETGVVFTDGDAVAEAVLKGQLMSNEQNGISSNSQRKLVRTDNGIYHMVYESSGFIWYTHSLTTNFYGGWSKEVILKEEIYVVAKNPAIDYYGNTISILFEYWDDNSVNIYYAEINTINGAYVHEKQFIISSNYNGFGVLKPVVSFVLNQRLIIYKESPSSNLKYRIRTYTAPTGWDWSSTPKDIPNTNQNSINPAVAGYKSETEHNIVYQQDNTVIKYIHADYRSVEELRFCSFTDLSLQSGFNINKYPTISFSEVSPPYAMVSWLGIYDSQQQSPLPKEQGGFEPVYREAAVVRIGFSTSWGTFSNFSDYVDYTNNGSLNTIYGSVMSWSESDGQYSKYVCRRNPYGYDPIQSLSDNGIQTMVSNGSEFGNIKAMVFNNSAEAPYLLNRCMNDFTYVPDGMGKLSEAGIIDISYGRSGIIEKNGIEFVFNIGDVLLNGETIKFIERVDTLPVLSIEELNLSVKTDTMSLNPESELIFSDYYYVVFGDKADSLLSNEFNVNFKCELVKLSTGEVIGLFEQVNYNKTNLDEYGHEGYLVDCSGIEAGDYYLRLTATVNEEVGLSLSDIQMDNVVLEKSSLNVRNFKGESIPVEYTLEQNYPNPFNPSTTIRYQIPKDGMVTLKVYDILGAEVATLVNEEKVAGRHEVNFNASSLASGVYIYRLNANDYVSVKKMVLLK